MLETSNLARKYKPICSFRKKIPFSAYATLTLLLSAFFCKKLAFFVQKKYLQLKQQCESCVRDFLVLFSVFVRQKVPITENITFADSVSGIRPPGCSKLPKNKKNINDVIIFRYDSNVHIFDIVLFLLSNLVTGRTFMSISSLVLEL